MDREGLSVDLGTQSPPDRRLRLSISPVSLVVRAFSSCHEVGDIRFHLLVYIFLGPLRFWGKGVLFFKDFLVFPFLNFFSRPSFSLITHTGASINRDGARRALIGAARMAEQSREHARPFTGCRPTHCSRDLTWLPREFGETDGNVWV